MVNGAETGPGSAEVQADRLWGPGAAGLDTPLRPSVKTWDGPIAAGTGRVTVDRSAETAGSAMSWPLTR